MCDETACWAVRRLESHHGKAPFTLVLNTPEMLSEALLSRPAATADCHHESVKHKHENYDRKYLGKCRVKQ
eukprot:5504918-Amphidinium_carterae.1